MRLLLAVFAFSIAAAAASVSAADAIPPTPVVTLTAAVTSSVPNDRMYAWLRAEADHADAARAAAEVNGRMAKALARAKAISGVDAQTSGYSSFQVAEKNQPPRWRVAQTLTLEGADFAAIAALVSKLQSEDQLVLSGMNFAVSPDTRRKAEDAITLQAIKAWQARAQTAARGFGTGSWRVGKVTIETGDFARPQPMMRASSMNYAAGAPPVAVEAGNTDITVRVVGEAVLDAGQPR